jgi:transmembrane sensor
VTMPPFPLNSVLKKGVDHETIHRMWLGIAVRRAERRRVLARWDLLLAFGAGLSAALLLLALTGTTPWQRRPVVVRPVEGALVLENDIDWPMVDTPRSDTRTLQFSDGSRIWLDPAARMAPLENNARSIAVLFKTGRAVFDVHPGGSRRWSIEAGLATIEVVGTRFVVTRTTGALTVEVEHGTVLVRGERVVDRVQRLGAGERLTIEREPPTVASVLSPPADDSPAPPSRPFRERATHDSSPSWRELARQGAYAQAYENLGPDGIAGRAKTADLDQLLALADVARLSGHPRDAIEPLTKAVHEHSSDRGAALAAFTLGRIHIDSLGEAAAAAHDFETAIRLGLPQALVEDAYLRLIEVRAKAGDRQGAHATWLVHHERFPLSTRQSIADRWGREP